MSKKKTVLMPVSVDDVVPDTELETEKQTAAERAAEYSKETAGMDDDDAEELFKGLDELRTQQGVTFQVFRVEPHDKAGFCVEYPASVFSQERVAREWGPGVYRIKVKANGRYVPGGGPMRIAAGMLPPEMMAAPPKTGVEDVLAILKADKEAATGKLKEWAVILTPLLVPVVSRFMESKNQVAELVQALAALQGLQPKPEKPPDFNTQFDNILQLTAKIKDLAGEDKSTTGATWIDLIRDGIKGAQPLLEGIAGRLSQANPSGVGIPMSPPSLPAPLPAVAPTPAGSGSPASLAPSTVAAPSSNNGAQPVGLVSLLPWLNATLQTLVLQAARNKDPELYAEVTLDNLPDGVDAKALIPFLERPDWWQQLQQFSPQVAPYPAWFEDYRNAVLALLKEDAEQTAPTVHPPDRGPQDDPQPMAPGELDPGDGM